MNLRFPIEICCDDMAANIAKTSVDTTAVIEAYPIDNKVEVSVNGCCGGGCFVLSDIHFCPFCGKEIMVRVKDVEAV